MWETRGNAQRYCRNTLVFLAVDKTRLQDLDDAICTYLAWESIINDRERLDLTPNQVRESETQRDGTDGVVKARIPEAYQWLLVPVQPDAKKPIEWKAYRLTGQESLAARASKRLKNEEQLIAKLAGTNLRLDLDKIPLWRGDHVAVKQLADDFAQFCYLPRLKDTDVLLGAIQNGVSAMLWRNDTFAYADSYDDDAKRYRGLVCGRQMSIMSSSMSGLVVRADVAEKQIVAESAPKPTTNGSPGSTITTAAGDVSGSVSDTGKPDNPAKANLPKRFYGTVSLDPARTGRDAGRIAEEIITHLVALNGAEVKVTLEIEADIPSGVPDNVVRTVTENSRTLKFTSHGFEKE